MLHSFRPILRLLIPLFPLIATGIISGCGSDDPVGPPDIVLPGDNEMVEYTKHIEPIFLNSCAGSDCHVGGRSASLSLANYNDLIEGSDFGAVVIPFAPVKSHLFQHINTDTNLGPRATPTMPYGRDPLPREQILAIRRWIEEGAQGPDGEVPLAGENRRRVFVTCQSEDLVTAIDLATGLISRYIPVGSRPDIEAPHNILLSPDGKSFYVVLIGSGVVEKYDAGTFELLGSVEVGLSPAQLRVTTDGSRLYASNFDLTFQQPFVYTFSSSMTGGSTPIDVEGDAPHGITFSRDEKLLYTMNAGSDDISVIDLTTNDVVARIPIVPGTPPAPAGSAVHEPYQSEIAPDGLMYVTCRKSGQVRVVDLQERRVIDSIVVGSRPLIGAISPDGSQFWVPNQGSNTLSIVDFSTRSVVGTITGFNDQPHAVAFSPDGSTAFVSCENQKGGANLHHPIEGNDAVPGIVYTVDVPSRTIERTIEVAGFAAGIAVQQ